MFDNLRKTIAYSLAHAVPEVFPILLTLAFGLPLALPGLLILVIDLITEQGPAISFAYERAEEAVMRRPPRDLVHDRLISPGLLFYAYAVAGVGNSACASIAGAAARFARARACVCVLVCVCACTPRAPCAHAYLVRAHTPTLPAPNLPHPRAGSWWSAWQRPRR